MSSPSHCARPAVPPKPDKDKIVSSPPTPSARQHQQDPFGLMKLSTVGTQVNMLRRPPASTSTSSSTGPRSPRSPSAEGRHQCQSQGESEIEEAGKQSLTSPKPALPPKPKPSPSAVTNNANTKKEITSPGAVAKRLNSNANSSTATSSLISKFNSSTNTTTILSGTTSTSNLTAHARINKFENLRNSSSCFNTNSNTNFKINSNKLAATTNNTAPVARIDELDNLSDLINSPSPVKIQSPPQSLRQPVAKQVSTKSSSLVNASRPPPHGLQPQPKTVTNPALSPKNTEKCASGPNSIFQFPPSTSIVNKSIFSTQQIQQRQTKSASLGRNVNFSTSGSASVSLGNTFSIKKKSITLSRVTPSDLQLSIPTPALANQNNQNLKANNPILRTKSPNSAPVVPARPISFTRPISANIFSPKEIPLGAVPPPPPPRMRKAQRALSLTSPTSSEAGTLSPTLQHHSSIPLPLSPGLDSTDNDFVDEYVKPVYATVDKEKKWADRQRQQTQNIGTTQLEHDTQNPINFSETSVDEDEFGEIRSNGNVNESEMELNNSSVIHSSLTISSKSWLGKFIDAENKFSTEEITSTEAYDSEKESMIIQRPNFNKTKNKKVFIDTDKNNGCGSGSGISSATTSMSHNTNPFSSTSHDQTPQCFKTLATNNNEEDNTTTTNVLVEAFNSNINVEHCAQDTNTQNINYGSTKTNTSSTNPFASSSASFSNHNQNNTRLISKSEHQTTTIAYNSNSTASVTPSEPVHVVNQSYSNTKYFTEQSDSSTSPATMIKYQENQNEENEKEPLGRNESFLFAMQDTNLKLKSKIGRDALQEETDNTVVVSKEIKLSSSAGVANTDNDSTSAIISTSTSHTSTSNNNNISNYQYESTLTTLGDAPSHKQDSTFNAKPEVCTLDLDPTNSFLYATFSQPELITSTTTATTPEIKVIENDLNPTQGISDSSNGVNPNRASVLDVFEKELESQLESLDYESQLSQSATFNTHEDNSYYRNKYANNNSNYSNTNRNIANIIEDVDVLGEENSNDENKNENLNVQNSDIGVKLVKEEKGESENQSQRNKTIVDKNDPSKYLEFVDSRLQSMQHLLAHMKTSPSSLQAECDSVDRVQNQNHKPVKVTFSTASAETEEANVLAGKMENQTDRDIVTNILLSSKRFEKNDQNQIQNQNANKSVEKTGRRATAPDLITSREADRENDHGSGPSSLSLVMETQCTSAASDKPSDHQRSLDIPEQDGIFRRRSWNSSDYSPSPSESSSSSCSYGHGLNHNHPRSSTSINRRRQVTSSWIDEDELSTGALGDGESSDAPAPSSIEDIDRATQGGESSRVVKRKHGGFVSSIFGSFGKGGQSSASSHSYYRSQTRSQFFLESDLSLVPDAENLVSVNPKILKAKDKTMSLPAVPARQRPPKGQNPKHWAHSSAEVQAENVHKPLRRSPVSCSSISSSTLPVPHASAIVESDSKTETEFDEINMKMKEQLNSNRPQSSDIVAVLATLGGDSSDVESVHSAGGSSVGAYEEILADLSKAQKKSFYVAREMLTSERTFVDVLNLLTLDFPLAMRMAGDANKTTVLSPKDMDFILGGLPTLKAVNEVLVSKLEERIRDWRENPKVADIIVKNGPFLKHYSTYVRDFERIVQRLDSCCGKSLAFAQAVKDFEGNVRCQKLGLRHYMLKPIQRMPQYRLLLEDYKKTLTEESEDYEDTLKAIAIVREVAEHANEAINLQINAEKLMHLQNRLPSIIVLKTNRFLLKEGELLKVCRKELQPRYFALMTDCVLCMTYNASTGTTNMKDLKLRYELPLTGMRISLPQNEDYLNEFSVISTSRSFNLVAKSAKERDEWMKKLQSAIQDNIKKRTCTPPDMEKERVGSEAPLWTPDKRVTMCQMCTAEFTVTFRRHHCRACGKVVCSNCSGNQAPLPYKKNEADRVCDDCYQYLLEEFDLENREKNTSDVNEIRARFKKHQFNTAGKANKNRRSIPDKFKMQANNSDSRISGYLLWRERKAWKRHWFVLMDRVLYVYAASEDIVAMKTIPVLGYQVEPIEEETFAGLSGELLFKLTHTGQNPIFFQAESALSAEKWLTAIKEASVLT